MKPRDVRGLMSPSYEVWAVYTVLPDAAPRGWRRWLGIFSVLRRWWRG